jgi:ArsR family metal-binding transcriptional regulator
MNFDIPKIIWGQPQGDKMLLEQIKNYKIFRPKCDYTKEILHGLATFEVDISPVFPYLNAELGGWDYDQRNHVLMLKLSAGKGFTLQPHEIAVKGAQDIREANAMLEWIKGQINDIYERREEITPRYTGQAGLRVMDILRLLPVTNCKACSYATCMAYAAALRGGEVKLEDCPPLWEEKCREKREKLQVYLESFGWRTLDAE